MNKDDSLLLGLQFLELQSKLVSCSQKCTTEETEQFAVESELKDIEDAS
jgi:hypothetical protein